MVFKFNKIQRIVKLLSYVGIIGICAIFFVARSASAKDFDDKDLGLACFLADGTLANATSGQLKLLDPITDSLRYKLPQTKMVTGLVCNPKKLQVLLRYKFSNDIKRTNFWGSVTIESGKAILVDVPIEASKSGDYYRENYNQSFFDVTGTLYKTLGFAISFSADGELLAVKKNLGRGSNGYFITGREFLSVFSSSNFAEIATININTLLGKSGEYQVMAIKAVSEHYVDVIATTRQHANSYHNNEDIRVVRWWFDKGQKDEKIIMRNNGTAVWDSHPLAGQFMIVRDSIISFASDNSDLGKFESFKTMRFFSERVAKILSKNAVMLIADVTHRDYGNDSCPWISMDSPKHFRPFIVEIGRSEVIKRPCGSIDPFGELAIDVERGYIFNTSKGSPDRLIKIEDFSDVRKQYFDSLQEKYGVTFRNSFVKANSNERYVPSVSNSKTVSETLFYVGGEPVTRYKNQTTTQEGYTEKVDLYNLVYEVGNNYTKPLAIKFRIEGLARSTSWAVKSLSGGFWQGLFGGNFSDKNVREKENIVLPMKIEKTLILKPGETFKSKDIWGELPASQNEVTIRAIEVQEVDPAWLSRLNDLLTEKISPTKERIDEFTSDSRSSWALEKLQTLHDKFRGIQEKQREQMLIKNIKVISTSIPKNFDVDFSNDISVALQNNNDVELEITVSIGVASTKVLVPAKGRSSAVVIVSGIKKSEIVPIISLIK